MIVRIYPNFYLGEWKRPFFLPSNSPARASFYLPLLQPCGWNEEVMDPKPEREPETPLIASSSSLTLSRTAHIEETQKTFYAPTFRKYRNTTNSFTKMTTIASTCEKEQLDRLPNSGIPKVLSSQPSAPVEAYTRLDPVRQAGTDKSSVHEGMETVSSLHHYTLALRVFLLHRMISRLEKNQNAEARIELLHDFNDIKDVAIKLIELVATCSNRTIAEVSKSFEAPDDKA